MSGSAADSQKREPGAKGGQVEKKEGEKRRVLTVP